MGFPDDQVLDLARVPSALRCAICTDIFQDPVFWGGRPCQHVFCRSCILKAMDRGHECPMCRATVRPQELQPHQMSHDLLDELQVRCPKGCGWTGSLCNRPAHMSCCPVATVEAQQAVIDRYKVTIDQCTTRITHLETDLGVSNTRIYDLENQLTCSEKRIDDLEISADRKSAEVRKWETKATELKDKMDAQRREHEDEKSNHRQELDEKMTKARQLVQLYEAKVLQERAHKCAAEKEKVAVEKELAALRQRTAEVKPRTLEGVKKCVLLHEAGVQTEPTPDPAGPMHVFERMGAIVDSILKDSSAACDDEYESVGPRDWEDYSNIDVSTEESTYELMNESFAESASPFQRGATCLKYNALVLLSCLDLGDVSNEWLGERRRGFLRDIEGAIRHIHRWLHLMSVAREVEENTIADLAALNRDLEALGGAGADFDDSASVRQGLEWKCDELAKARRSQVKATIGLLGMPRELALILNAEEAPEISKAPSVSDYHSQPFLALAAAAASRLVGRIKIPNLSS